MNAALLLLTTALGAGGDVVPAGWGERPLVVPASGCSNCAAPVAAPAAAPATLGPTTCCDPCVTAERPRLLDRLRARLSGLGSRFSARPAICNPCPPPPCCNPCPPAPCCDPCAAPAPSLLDRIKARFARPSCCLPVVPDCTTCGSSPVAPAQPAPSAPPKDAPKEMPKEAPKDPAPAKEPPKGSLKDAPPKDMPPAPPAEQPKAGGAGALPAIPEPVNLPPLPAAPETPRLSGSGSPY